MKNLTLIILITIHVSLFTVHLNSQPCLPEGIIFSSQAEIDSFPINYPNCTEIEGNVTIYGDDITNLNGINNLDFIGGDLILDRTSLVNLIGLGNIDSIMGDLHLEFNGNLKNLSGLWNLTFIGGSLTIISCYDLNSLTALENLNFIGEDINIHNNNDLPNLTGLENITHVSRDLILTSNGSTLNCLTGLNNISSIGRDLLVQGNYGLLNLEGLDNLSYVGGIFEIRSNNHMTSLVGVENLETVMGRLIITSVNKITSLEGLENLNLIEGDLKISGNELLTSIAELESIDAGSVSNLYITGNESLSECHVQYVCDFLASPNGSINIYNNAQGCSNPAEVANSCGFSIGCLPYGNYYFDSQGSIDNFQDMYPGCENLMGSVFISGDNITNLAGLINTTTIQNDLSIGGNETLIDLTGLDNLNSIGMSLSISSNDLLLNVNGLENLNYIGESLSIGIIAQAWEPWIMGNGSMNSLSGLEGLTSIGKNLLISGNHSLKYLNGLNNIVSIGGDFDVVDNDSLYSFSGIEQLTSVQGSLHIGSLLYYDYELVPYGNNSLTGISELDNLNYVGGDIWVLDNNVLTSLSGLDNIEPNSIDSLKIFQNPVLESCDVQSICDYLVAPNGIIEIHDNAPGCNSQEEIEAACDTVSVLEIIFEETLTIFPNPLESNSMIQYSLNHNSSVNLKILDLSGREMVVLVDEIQRKGENRVEFNTSGLSAGIYFCVLKTNQGIQTKKIIKL